MMDDKGNEFFDPFNTTIRRSRCNVVVVNRKTPRLKSRILKEKLTPIQTGETIDDNLYECHYCNKELTWYSVTVDHKTPLSKGGSNSILNIVPCCFKCNNEKKNVSYETFKKIKSTK